MLRSIAFRDHWTRTEKTFFDKGITMGSMEAYQDRLQRNIVFMISVRHTGEGDAMAAVVPAIATSGAVTAETELTGIDEETGDLLYDIVVYTTGDEQFAVARQAVEALDDIEVEGVIDAAMASHRGGSCEMVSDAITSNTDLRIVYTPGVARVCKAIEADPELAYEYTGIHNTVAIVTNGTAILGLGDIGNVAGMPVMEGKSAIFRNFAGISAIPILVDTKDVDEFVETVARIAPTFGAIQVEDVSAPTCFPITRRLDAMLDIPVMHDDQHGTATICLAGLDSALKKVGKEGQMANIRCVISGAGASGTAISELLQEAGIGDVILVDSKGIIYRGREVGMNEEKVALAARTNRENLQGGLADAMKGADLFIGCSLPNLVSIDMVKSMAAKPILFPLANPVSEISKADAEAGGAAVYADGRYMNNAIAYPGIFRGALDARAKQITLKMMLAAAETLASIVPEGQLLPEMMDPATHQAVAEAVKAAAE